MKPSTLQTTMTRSTIARTRQVWQPRLGRDLTARTPARSPQRHRLLRACSPNGRAPKRRLRRQRHRQGPPPKTARCAMTAETIAKALGGRKAGAAGWRAARRMRIASRACRSRDAQGRQGAGALPCRLRPARRDRRASRRAACGRQNGQRRRTLAAAPRSHRRTKPDRDDAEAHARRRSAIWQASQPAEGTPVETYLRSRGIAVTAAAFAFASMPG